MRRVAFTRFLRIMVTTIGLGLVTAACLTDTEDDFEMPKRADEMSGGPGLFTGSSGEAVYDVTTGKWSMGDGASNAIENEKTYEIRKRRARARRKVEGATAD